MVPVCINKFLEFKITYTPTELFNKFIEYCKTFNHKTEIINDKRLAAIIKELEESFLDTKRFIKLTPNDDQSQEEADSCPVAGTASFMIC